MEKRDEQIEITIPDQMDRLETSIRNKFGSLSCISYKDRCIYKIPEFIRKGNEKFYRPSVFSIGPVYYKDPALETIQELKWSALKGFIEHPSNNPNHNIKFYLETIREWEKKARDCYEVKISLSSDEFNEMILLDAAFIICAFMCNYFPGMRWPEVAENQSSLFFCYSSRDLFLLENQLPYFILNDLYDIAFGTDDENNVSFQKLTISFIANAFMLGSEAAKSSSIASERIGECDIKHLVDFLRICCLPTELFNPAKMQMQSFGLLNIQNGMTAKELHAAGVIFVACDGSENPLDVKFNKKNGVLEIPKFTLESTTEYTFRSIQFYEQCQYLYTTYISDYLCFLDALIDTVEDVQILVRKGILINVLGNDEKVVDLFNKLDPWATLNPDCYYYADVSRNLKQYASTPWNRWNAILKRDYFNNPWASISVIFAIVLFILTLLQAIAAFTN